jgi:DNA-binding CsgD family transcriptional regulator
VPALHSITVFEEFPKLVRARHEYFDFAERVCKIGDVLGVSTGVAEGRRAILGVQRAVDAVGYGAQEKTLIELVVQHIDLAKRVQIKLGEALLAKSELEAAFSHLTAAAFIVDAQRRVCHLNAAAECLLARHRQCITRNSKLAFSDARMDAAFAGAVKEAACELGRSAALPLTLGGATTEVLVAPLQPAHRLASPWQRPLALVAIPCDPDEKYIAWRMQQLYRLTPTESRVAAALAMGKTIERIALENAVTEATLRTQLKSIFSKTNTSRQAELVRLALAGITFR